MKIIRFSFKSMKLGLRGMVDPHMLEAKKKRFENLIE